MAELFGDNDDVEEGRRSCCRLSGKTSEQTPDQGVVFQCVQKMVLWVRSGLRHEAVCGRRLDSRTVEKVADIHDGEADRVDAETARELCRCQDLVGKLAM